jgi:hypothetical protein
MTRAERDRRKAIGIRNRICANSLAMVDVAMENLGAGVEGGSVRWSSAKELAQYEKVCRWAREAWSVVEMETIGATFYREHERVMVRVQGVVEATWQSNWGVEEYGQYLLVCSRVIDDALRLLPPGRRQAWKWLADSLAAFVALFMAQFGDGIEDVGGPASEAVSELILDGQDFVRRCAT